MAYYIFMNNCAICKLSFENDELNFHHLIPKAFHNNKRILKQYDKSFLNDYGINVCFACHNKIHSCILEKDLAFEFNTLEKLIEHEEIKTWINWKQKHPDFKKTYNKMSTKRKNSY